MHKLEIDTLAWVDWFNTKPLLVPIGNIPPAEAEKNLYAQRDVIDMAARNEAIGCRNTRGESVAKTHKKVLLGLVPPRVFKLIRVRKRVTKYEAMPSRSRNMASYFLHVLVRRYLVIW